MIAARFFPACGARIPAIGGCCSRRWKSALRSQPLDRLRFLFLLESPSQFRTDGPNDLASAAYAEEFNEVKELGALEISADAGADPHRGVREHPSRPDLERVARRLAEDPSRRLDSPTRPACLRCST